MRARGDDPYPGPLRPHAHARPRSASTGTTASTIGTTSDDVVSVAGRVVLRRVQGKLVFVDAPRRHRRAAAVRQQGRARRRRVRPLRRRDRARRLGRRRGHGHEDQEGRALGEREDVHAALQVAAAAAREVARPLRHRHPLPPALRRPHRQRRRAPRLRGPLRARSPRSRAFLAERGFVEVETPVLHPILGGATGAAVRRRTTTRSTPTSTCASRPSCT